MAVIDIFAIAVPEQRNSCISGTQNIRTRLRPATQLGPAPGDWCDALQQLRRPCMAMVKSRESQPQSKTWETQDFANIKQKS